MDVTRHEGKTVIVTGAANGIGEAIARRFHAEGAHTVLADLDETRLKEVTEDLGSRATSLPVDVSDREKVDALIDAAVRITGRLDVLVNNAGIGNVARVGDLTDEAWHRVLGIDLHGVFYCSRAALPHLIATRGTIVNTTSTSGLGGNYGFAAYGAAKGAVVNLTRQMAVDYAADGVRVNAVAPGPINSKPGPGSAFEAPAMVKVFRRNIPMGRAGLSPEVAAAVSFLASSEASYITGQNLVVDGGLLAHTGEPNYAELLRLS
ncbi:meso-butanediol dehydrogenase/(S,S)-butanediol dehydrogenase/diacetyl reductase [Actinocorallia herbida]|uniref:Meso-butanediol dehydrogenase/(S,S)-butanediol dehydrogenase/diacetyl reductase n=1 Tax=Actinocorallia herbida TaxID=58109 RepID=A0A3N1D319_9ACTN|nr:SDR family NAD(P)-dependent oxidoreductase [Actinocorallia herbida]ROO87876.1 meso-butanediol dehydrogenase/(S,S)-butanediol dehydrogenase/diacetyl reductase [Actinocorallia herbida]